MIVGQQGMGKTMLAERFLEEIRDAKGHGGVYYEMGANDDAPTVLARMVDDLYIATGVKERTSDWSRKTLKQMDELLKLVKLDDLVKSLRDDPERSSREKFIEAVHLVAARMPDDRRAVFVVDPYKLLRSEDADEWGMVARELPPKVKLLFLQRPEDALARDSKFRTLRNVVFVPPHGLERLAPDAVDVLIGECHADTGISIPDLRAALGRYEGHPFSVQGAIELLKDRLPLLDLPLDPKRIAEAQWGRICELGEEAISLFHAYAILEVPVPDDLADKVAEVPHNKRRGLLGGSHFLGGLLRQADRSARIYHSLLSTFIVETLPPQEAKPVHQRAAQAYRERLHATEKPDELAAQRLPWHVLRSEGEQAFVACFVGECTGPLVLRGLLNVMIALSHQALAVTRGDEASEAVLSGNLGNVLRIRGDLVGAEAMFRKALEIEERLGRPEGMADNYGDLGIVMQIPGDLEGAEVMHRKALEINEGLGRPEGMASNYRNLGLLQLRRGEEKAAYGSLQRALDLFEKLGAAPEADGTRETLEEAFNQS